MTIDKAIEILTLDKTLDFEGDANDLDDALQVGIEGLKLIKSLRKATVLNPAFKLPGETED